MSKEQKLLKKTKKLVLKLVRWGIKLDEYNIPFELTYQNGTFLKQNKIEK